MIKLKSLIEQKVNKNEYDARGQFIQSYIDKLVQSCPGNTQQEKLTYAWEHHKQKMLKLIKGLDMLRIPSVFGRIGDEPLQSQKSKFIADKYYIRFGGLPSGGKSTNWITKKKEIGVSAYPVKWNIQKNKWEIEEIQLESLDALYSFTGEISQGNGRPAYLIQGQELNNIGSDGEPMLDCNNIKIIKQLQPYEFFSKEIGEDWYVND